MRCGTAKPAHSKISIDDAVIILAANGMKASDGIVKAIRMSFFDVFDLNFKILRTLHRSDFKKKRVWTPAQRERMSRVFKKSKTQSLLKGETSLTVE